MSRALVEPTELMRGRRCRPMWWRRSAGPRGRMAAGLGAARFPWTAEVRAAYGRSVLEGTMLSHTTLRWLWVVRRLLAAFGVDDAQIDETAERVGVAVGHEPHARGTSPRRRRLPGRRHRARRSPGPRCARRRRRFGDRCPRCRSAAPGSRVRWVWAWRVCPGRVRRVRRGRGGCRTRGWQLSERNMSSGRSPGARKTGTMMMAVRASPGSWRRARPMSRTMSKMLNSGFMRATARARRSTPSARTRTLPSTARRAMLP